MRPFTETRPARTSACASDRDAMPSFDSARSSDTKPGARTPLLSFRMRLPLTAIVASTLLLSSAPRASDAVHWPQWRGEGGTGVSTASDYPAEWSPTTNVAWKTRIQGRGHSSPVVWGDRVFLTSSIQGEHVPDHKAPDHLGYDLKPGYLHPDSVGADYKYALKVLALDAPAARCCGSTPPYDGLMHDNRHRKNTYASPTPVTDGTLVYFYFEAAGLYAYDFTGRQVWKSGALGTIAKGGMGPGTSPILYEDLLIVQAIRRWARTRRWWRSTRTPGAKCGARPARRDGAGRRR